MVVFVLENSRPQIVQFLYSFYSFFSEVFNLNLSGSLDFVLKVINTEAVLILKHFLF
jgi:hypothetical protein